MKIPILRLPYSDEEIVELQEGMAQVLRSGMLTKGETVTLFEQEWAKYCGTKYAVACTSGTAALEIIFRAIGVVGKEVIMPSNTFIATATAAIRAGAKVVLADCERENLQLSLQSAMDCQTENTAAIVLVHIGGYITPKLSIFQLWCKKEGMVLLEDAAHAHGSEYGRQKAGSLGKAAAFSFYPTKVLTSGEGGVVTTDDPEIYEKCRSLVDCSRIKDNPQIHWEAGYNWRMDGIRAVLALQQTRKADSILAERRKIAHRYDELLWGQKGITILKMPRHISPAYYKYVIFLNKSLDRDKIRAAMEKKEIRMPGLVYEIPLHRQPAFLGQYQDDAYPNTNEISQHHLCLPLFLGLTDEEIDYIVTSLKETIG